MVGAIVGVGNSCSQYQMKFHNSMEKACISVVPVHGDSPICAAHRETGAMVAVALVVKLRPSSWSIGVVTTVVAIDRLEIQYLDSQALHECISFAWR